MSFSSNFTLTCCPSCGVTFPVTAPSPQQPRATRDRVRELESTVRMLTRTAGAAAEKLADYEEYWNSAIYEPDVDTESEYQSDHADVESPTASMAPPRPTTPAASVAAQHADPIQRAASADAKLGSSDPAKDLPAIPYTESPERIGTSAKTSSPPATRPGVTSAASRLSSFLSSSRQPSSSSTPPPQPQSQQGSGLKHQPSADSISRNEADLLTILSREQALRHEAETRLENVNTELEELSASLFQQANEMVAEERRARAKLEQRAATLEEKVKVLEKRDGEKRKRLERLENAVLRIDRVRGLLGGEQTGSTGLTVPPPPKYEEG